MTAVTDLSDSGAQEKKICHCFHFSLFYLPRSAETWCDDLSFLNVVFSQLFHSSLSKEELKRLFNSSSLSAIRVVASTYLTLLIFLLAILIPACDSSSPAFHMIYSAQKLNKQDENIQPYTLFPILNQSFVPCKVLTVVSWILSFNQIFTVLFHPHQEVLFFRWY